MMRLASERQQMDAPTLELLLKMLMPVRPDDRRAGMLNARLVELWPGLRPAAEGLSSDVVMQLLAAAALHGRYRTAQLLLELPAAQQFSADALVGLLLYTADMGAVGDDLGIARARHMERLCSLATSQQLSCKAVVQLLQVSESLDL